MKIDAFGADLTLLLNKIIIIIQLSPVYVVILTETLQVSLCVYISERLEVDIFFTCKSHC